MPAGNFRLCHETEGNAFTTNFSLIKIMVREYEKCFVEYFISIIKCCTSPVETRTRSLLSVPTPGRSVPEETPRSQFDWICITIILKYLEELDGINIASVRVIQKLMCLGCGMDQFIVLWRLVFGTVLLGGGNHKYKSDLSCGETWRWKRKTRENFQGWRRTPK